MRHTLVQLAKASARFASPLRANHRCAPSRSTDGGLLGACLPARSLRVRARAVRPHVAACVPCRPSARASAPLPPAPAQIRISSQHLQSGQFSGQQVRAVGKLVSHNGDTVQLQLAGEGEPSGARAHATQRQHTRVADERCSSHRSSDRQAPQRRCTAAMTDRGRTRTIRWIRASSRSSAPCKPTAPSSP